MSPGSSLAANGGTAERFEGGSPIVELRQLRKRYGSVEAVRGIDLEVAAGELVTLLGPSGCGKTTVMRTVAGFEEPDSGAVRIQGRDVTGVPPNRRPVNMVFQQYALFPHLDVVSNVEFGPRMHRVARADRRARALEMIGVVGLEGLESRMPNQLSGGQAQRVALARALVNRPAVLLLDEPLSALDLKIRQQMQAELKRVHAELGTTFLYVTHDQEEAMTLSDRVVLMNMGRVLQIGTPEQIYTRPTSVFSARFVGDVNLLTGAITQVERDVVSVRVGEIAIRAVHADTSERPKVGQEVTVAIRPEAVTITAGHEGEDFNRMSGEVADATFVGDRIRYRVRGARGSLIHCQRVSVGSPDPLTDGGRVTARWSPDAAVVINEIQEPSNRQEAA